MTPLDRVGPDVRALLDQASSPRRARWAALAVVQGEHAASAVVARSGETVAIPRDARFLLYSVTKTIVAAALLRLVARGVLALDQALGASLPEFAPAARITLRQVLQHASGLPDYGELAAYHDAVRAGGEPWTFDDFLARTEAERLRFAPGAGWAYSNIGYALLARVLERAGGGDTASVLAREIFAPLAVASASVPTRRSDLAAFAFGPSPYLGCDGGSVPARYHPGWIATGVVGATALDAARLLHGLFTTDLLPRALRDAMRRAVRVGGPIAGRPWIEPGYGLGLQVEMSPTAEPWFGHTGGGPGCSPAVYHFPRDVPLTVAVVTDGEDIGQAETVALAVARNRAS